MAFWSSATEPLRKNRWVVIFGSANPLTSLSDFAYALKKVDKPSYKTLDITHKFGNYSFYYPGRVEWNTINMTFASVVEQNSAGGIRSVDRQLLQILKASNPSNNFSGVSNDQANALKGISKKVAGSAIGTLSIVQLGADGDAKTPIETWQLTNAFFTNIKFGDLSYDSEEVVDVEVTVRYDTAVYTAGANKES